EDQLHLAQRSDQQLVGHFAERALNPGPARILQALDLIQTRAADHAQYPSRHAAPPSMSALSPSGGGLAIVRSMRRAIAPLILLGALAAAPGAWAGEARCWYENGALVVSAALGDIAGDFILDVSATTSALNNTN